MNIISLPDAQAAIKSYLGNNSFQIESYNVGNFIYIDISYYDFLPSRQVRRDIEDMIPNAASVSVERLYSDETYNSVLKYLGLGDSDESILEAEFYLMDKTL